MRQEWILVAQILFALWNVINDPIFGQLQDKTRTESGRYIPWIKYSIPFFSVAFVMVFLPSQNWRVAGADLFQEEQILLFIWYLASQALYDTFFTIMYIAHTALLPQMTMDSKERTQIAILSTFTSFTGAIISVVPISLLTDPNPDKIFMLRIVVAIIAVIGIIPWIFVVKYVKERQEYIPAQETSFIENIRHVFRNPSGRIYVLYDGISVGILNFLGTGITFALTWVFGLNSEYYEVNPDWGFTSLIPYIIPVLISAVIGAIVQLKIPDKKDVKTALMVGLVSEAIGFTIAFLGCLPPLGADPSQPMLPGNLWLISLGLTIAGFGISSDFIYHNPMRADTIDYDEYLTGERRESVYAGIGCVLSKPMISVALASVSGIITSFGLIATPESMTEISTSLYWSQGYDAAMIGVGIAIFLIPGLLALLGVFLWRRYPLDREALEQLHVDLDELHIKKREENLNEDGTSKYVRKR